MRRHVFNERYFASVETPEQAYWLGFIAADGYVLTNGTALGINLGVDDVAHLELFRSTMGAGDVPFHQITAGYGTRPTYHLRLYSMQLVRDVARLGIVPHKSLHCEPWDAPAALASHYWRGCIDGDGHVAPSGRSVSLCGTQAMTEGFRSFAAAICGTAAVPFQQRRLWVMNVMGRKQVHAMLSALYSPACVALARKKEAALRITAEPYKPKTSPPCRVKGCPRISVARKLCGKHYQAELNHGDPLATTLDRGPDGRFRKLAA